MRHRLKVNRLSRATDVRIEMLISQSYLLFQQGKLVTTTARAKVTRGFVNTLLVKANKLSGVEQMRYIQKYLKSTKKAEFVIEKVLPALDKEKTNYLRIAKLENRKGDNSAMSILILDVQKKEEKSKVKAKASEKEVKKESKKTKKN